MRNLRALAATVAASIALLGVVSSPSTADSPTLQAFFNDPQVTGDMDTSLGDHVDDLIKLAAPGSRIDIAVYTFVNKDLSADLIAASQRGVAITLVGEDCTDPADCSASGPGDVLLGLKASLPAGAVTLCHIGCLGPDTDINHQKIWVFSKLTDGRTDVVVQSSENIPDGPDPLHNNSLISTNDAGFAAGYRDVIATMKAQVHHAWSGTITSSSGKLTAWMSPRDTAADATAYGDTDFLAAQLKDVDCSHPGGSIRFVESQWDTDRPHINDAVLAAKSAGCHVEILLSNSQPSTKNTLDFVKAGIPVYMFRPGSCRYGINGCAVGDIHSKYILVDGWSRTAGGPKKYVFMGSHNIVKGSLVNADDAVVRVDDSTIYNDYDGNFAQLHDEAIKISPTAYPDASLTSVNTVNNSGAGDQRRPAMASSRTGYRAVVWEDDPDNASVAGTQIWIRGYGPTGATLYEERVDQAGTGGWSHQQPDVALDSAGNAYVAWSEDADGNGSTNIDLRRVAPDGTMSATIFPNDPEWRGDQLNPHVAVAPSGAFTVAWEDKADPASATTHIHAAGYSSLTTRSWGPIQLDAASLADRPDIAMDGTGATVAVWQQNTDIAQARITAAGSLTRATTTVNSTTAIQQVGPAVAVTPGGDAVVAWSSHLSSDPNNWRIRTRGFTSSFAQRFPETQVTPEATANMYPALGVQGQPRVGISDAGQFVISWNEIDAFEDRGTEVYAAGLNSDGSRAGRFPATRMNPIVQGPQSTTALAVSPAGSFDLAFQGDDDQNGYYDIAGRFGFLNVPY